MFLYLLSDHFTNAPGRKIGPPASEGVREIKSNTAGTIVLLAFVLLIAITCITGIPPVSAHAPLGTGSNENISSATVISDPEKSYVIYADLHGPGEAQYYQFPMVQGQALYGSVNIPGPGRMVPDLVIIGPGISPSVEVPQYIEVPPGSGAMVITGTPPGKPSYEPFSPQPVYEVARFNVSIPKDGSYYIAVYGPTGGKYSLAPGFLEQFTLPEWLLVPFAVLTIYLWEGQSPAAILIPLLVIVLGGLVLLIREQKRSGVPWGYREWMVLTAGLLYLGGAAVMAGQAVHTVLLTGYTASVIVTLVFIAVPVILGIFVIRTGLTHTREKRPGLATGFGVVLAGLIGLVVWAGYIIGPVLALTGGLLILIRAMEKNHS